MKKKFELVIFDCDGVLVDSEMITNRVFAGMLNELGISVSIEDMFERFVGRSMPQCLEIITGLLGGPVPDGFVDEYYARSRAAVARSKPFPDVYLHAARQQGFDPTVCAVIEDTPTGVRAGVAAGMTVYGYCARTPKHQLIEAGAQQTFARMSDLPDLLSVS